MFLGLKDYRGLREEARRRLAEIPDMRLVSRWLVSSGLSNAHAPERKRGSLAGSCGHNEVSAEAVWIRAEDLRRGNDQRLCRSAFGES